MASYTTKDGDMLDAICDEHYGRTDGTLEMVLDANRALAYQPTVLEAGLVIELPDLPEEKKIVSPTVELWD